MSKTRFEELKFKSPEDTSTIPFKGVERVSKKIKANHTVLPILEGNEYTLIATGRDYYTVKCQGSPVYCEKFVFDAPPKRTPKWLQDQIEDNNEIYD